MTLAMLLARLEWQGLDMLPTALLIVAALLAAVMWLYPRQMRGLDAPWPWLLPSLRVLTLIVLVMSLLRPVVVRERQSSEAGAIAIVVDRSRSMGVVDSGRSPAALVRLADGLGLLEDDARPQVAAELPLQIQELRSLVVAAMRANGELQYARLAGRGVDAAKQRLADARQAVARQIAACRVAVQPLADNAKLVEALDQLADLDRTTPDDQLGALNTQLDAVQRLINRHIDQLDEALYHSDPAVRQICQELAKRSRIELVAAALAGSERSLLRQVDPQVLLFGYTVADDLRPLPLLRGGQPVDQIAIAADGHRSHISAAVPQVLEQLAGRPVHAVVLFTDGRQVGGEHRVVSSLFSSGVPVFTVMTAPEQGTADLAITRLDTPQAFFAGHAATVRADLRVRGSARGKALVRLLADGQTHQQQVELKPDQTLTVEFPLTLSTAGIHEIRVEVEPRDGEAAIDNNHAVRRVKVLDQPARVTALAGPGTWEFQYLRNLLERAPWIELNETILHTAPATLSPQQILETDVLILSDVPAASLDAAQRDAIHRLVTERGGSVILMAGDAHLPEEYVDDVLFQALLPWRTGAGMPVWRHWPGEAPGFRAVPAAQLPKADLLRLADDADIAAPWLRLQPMFRILALPELKPNTQPLLVERESNLPLLTESRLGAGRVYFAAFNESWRWRYKSGDTYHGRFWLQLVRHAAEAPYAVRNAQYAFDADALSIEPDQSLRVRAKRLDDTATAALAVRVMRDGQQVDMLPLTALAADTRRFERILPPLAQGEYELQLIADASDQPKLILPLSVRQTFEPELQDLSPDPALLRHLAESSGGMMLSLDTLPQLAPHLQQRVAQKPTTIRQSLWDSPYLFCFVLGCLSLEWALRKRLGLA